MSQEARCLLLLVFFCPYFECDCSSGDCVKVNATMPRRVVNLAYVDGFGLKSVEFLALR